MTEVWSDGDIAIVRAAVTGREPEKAERGIDPDERLGKSTPLLLTALELLLRRRFPPSCDIREITSFLAQRLPEIPDFEEAYANRLMAESWIRGLLGELDLLEGIDFELAADLMTVLPSVLARDLALSEEEIAELVREASLNCRYGHDGNGMVGVLMGHVGT